MRGWRSRERVGEYKALEVLRFPLYLENLLAILLFSVLFIVATLYLMLPAGMGIRSVGFWFLCVTIFANYGFVIVEQTSHGRQHIPKLSGTLVFPLSDSRFYSVAILTIPVPVGLLRDGRC